MQAESLFRRALAAREKAAGEHDQETLATLEALALLLHTRGKLADAIELFTRARESKRSILGAEHPETLNVVCELGLCHHSQGDLLTADLADATHVYVASLCFDDALLARLSERLSTPGVAPRLRALATLRAFPRGFAPAALPWRETRRIEMSWSRHGSGTKSRSAGSSSIRPQCRVCGGRSRHWAR